MDDNPKYRYFKAMTQKFERRLALAEEIIKYYADQNNYDYHPAPHGGLQVPVEVDGGQKARNFLTHPEKDIDDKNTIL